MSTYYTSRAGHSKKNAYLVFFLAATFYLYEFILQVSPAVMMKPIMQTFNVGAAGFGAISAFYFYAYAPMQLPAGLLFDRYGPRLLVTLALLLCASGTLFFALTQSIFFAAAGRFLVGIGSAFSFIGVLVLISRWLPATQFALFAGIAQLMSSLGAIFGEAPLAFLQDIVGWRIAQVILAGIGFILALLVWNIVRDNPDGKAQEIKPINFHYEWKKLTTVAKMLQSWWVGLYATTIWTPIAVFGGLWGVAYLEARYQISTLKASTAVTMMWLGVGIGSPFLGWLTDRLQSRKLSLMIGSMLGLSCTLFLLTFPSLPLSWVYGLLFVIGMGSGGQSISFAVIKDNNSLRLLGTASGFNNFVLLVGVAICQTLVGYLLVAFWQGNMVHGVPVYLESAYQKAFWLLPISYTLSLLISTFMIKESYHKE